MRFGAEGGPKDVSNLKITNSPECDGLKAVVDLDITLEKKIRKHG
jgi:hypothetical protein